jgi:hypothetical protein
MKKILLICLSAGIGISAGAQQIEKRLPVGFQQAEIPAHVRKNAVTMHKDAFRIDNQVPLNNSQARSSAAPSGSKNNRVSTTIMEEEIIGFTYYDLQTNNSISNRLVRNDDGSISAAWTFSPNATVDFPQRGTGYNYYDPNTPIAPYTSHWYFSPDGPGGDFPQARTEGAYRTGFTNIYVTPSGREMTVGHSSTTGFVRLLMNSRPTKGTGAWTQQLNSLGTAPNNDTWAKMAGSGDTVYVIAQGTGVQDPPVPLYGQDGPILFSRSVDGGQTFPILRSVINEIDSNYYDGFGADNYSIDARGNNVAIVYGDLGTDLGLLKSTDGGATWTKTIIVTMPIPFFNFDSMLTDVDGDGIYDTLFTSSGDPHVMIDHSGMAHVWFGSSEWWRDTTHDVGFLSAQLTDGLFYWNETMAPDAYVQIAASQDYNGNGTLDFPQDETCARPYGRYGFSLTSRPSAGIDASGTMYVTYMALNEAADTAIWHQMHTHIYIITSPDNGQTWTYPMDLVLPQAMGGDGELQECAYASVARHVDNWVYVLYQRDPAPGNSLSTETCDAANNTVANDIVFVKIESATVSVPKVDRAENVSVSQNFPNPSRGATAFDVSINKNSDITIQVTDLIGRVIHSETRTNAASGIHTIQLNTSKWNDGIYLYTVQTQGQKITRQMIVQ